MDRRLLVWENRCFKLISSSCGTAVRIRRNWARANKTGQLSGSSKEIKVLLEEKWGE